MDGYRWSLTVKAFRHGRGGCSEDKDIGKAMLRAAGFRYEEVRRGVRVFISPNWHWDFPSWTCVVAPSGERVFGSPSLAECFDATLKAFPRNADVLSHVAGWRPIAGFSSREELELRLAALGPVEGGR